MIGSLYIQHTCEYTLIYYCNMQCQISGYRVILSGARILWHVPHCSNIFDVHLSSFVVVICLPHACICCHRLYVIYIICSLCSLFTQTIPRNQGTIQCLQNSFFQFNYSYVYTIIFIFVNTWYLRRQYIFLTCIKFFY